MFLYILLGITSILIILYILKLTKSIKTLNEKFESSNSKNMSALWEYFNTINEKYKKNEELRKKVTKGITEHYSEVEKFRMSKKIAKPLDKID